MNDFVGKVIDFVGKLIGFVGNLIDFVGKFLFFERILVISESNGGKSGDSYNNKD